MISTFGPAETIASFILRKEVAEKVVAVVFENERRVRRYEQLCLGLLRDCIISG